MLLIYLCIFLFIFFIFYELFLICTKINSSKKVQKSTLFSVYNIRKSVAAQGKR